MSNKPTTNTTTSNTEVFPSAWLFEYSNGSSFFTREKEDADLAKENPEDIVQVTEYFANSAQSGVAAKPRDMPVASVFKAELFVARDTKQAFNTIVELPDADLKHGELLYRKQALLKPEPRPTSVNDLVEANTRLLDCLENLCSIAQCVDGWESFPSEPLDSAHRLIEEISAQIKQIQMRSEQTKDQQTNPTPGPDFAADLAHEIQTLTKIERTRSALAKIDLRIGLDKQSTKLLSNWIGDDGKEQPIVLWIGEAQFSDGSLYGLNVSAADYPDEGCEHLVTLPRNFLESVPNN